LLENVSPALILVPIVMVKVKITARNAQLVLISSRTSSVSPAHARLALLQPHLIHSDVKPILAMLPAHNARDQRIVIVPLVHQTTISSMVSAKSEPAMNPASNATRLLIQKRAHHALPELLSKPTNHALAQLEISNN